MMPRTNGNKMYVTVIITQRTGSANREDYNKI